MATKHRHGGNPLADLARLNLPEGKIIDFSVNLNPAVSLDVITLTGKIIDAVQDYPTLMARGSLIFIHARQHKA
jgi:hypothetical protein